MEPEPQQNQTSETAEQRETQRPTPEAQLKTIAVRVEEGLHAQLQFIAQLSGSTIADEVRNGIQQRIAHAQTDPTLIAKAQEARDRIERQARLRSDAIAGFIGLTATAEATAEASTPDVPASSAATTADAPAPARTRRSRSSDKGSA